MGRACPRPEVVAPGDRKSVEARLRRLNELGFDVEEFELVRSPDGTEVRVHALVLEEGHHSRRLKQLTGLAVQENQARRLLNDITGFRLHLEHLEGAPLPDALAAYRWLKEVFEPAIAKVPPRLRGSSRRPSCSTRSSSTAGSVRARNTEVSTDEATEDYVRSVLSDHTEEFNVLPPRPGRDDPDA